MAKLRLYPRVAAIEQALNERIWSQSMLCKKSGLKPSQISSLLANEHCGEHVALAVVKGLRKYRNPPDGPRVERPTIGKLFSVTKSALGLGYMRKRDATDELKSVFLKVLDAKEVDRLKQLLSENGYTAEQVTILPEFVQ